MFDVNINTSTTPHCELEHDGEVFTVHQQTIVFLTPKDAHKGAGIRLFCDHGLHSKALWCFETDELHLPERVESYERLTFLRSFVFAIVRAAEGLEITGPGEVAPGLEPVASYMSAVNRLVCAPPFSDAEVEEIAGRYYADAVDLVPAWRGREKAAHAERL